jgi:hypothetical protein
MEISHVKVEALSLFSILTLHMNISYYVCGKRLFILFIMFFGSLRIILGVNRDRVLDQNNAGDDEKESERKNRLRQRYFCPAPYRD